MMKGVECCSDTDSDQWLMKEDNHNLPRTLTRRRSDPREFLGSPSSSSASASDTNIAATMAHPSQGSASQTLRDRELADLIRSSVTAGIADYHKIHVAPLESKLQQLQRRIRVVDKVSKDSDQEIVGEYKSLSLRVQALENKLNETKRVHTPNSHVAPAAITVRTNNLIILGLEEVRHEKPVEIVKDFAHALKVEISQIQARRIGRGNKRPILVEFAKIWEKRKMYSMRTHLKDNGYAGVFINEDLTPDQSAVFFHARQAKKQKLINSTWTMNGVTQIAKYSRNGQLISVPVMSLEHLQTLIPGLEIINNNTRNSSSPRDTVHNKNHSNEGHDEHVLTNQPHQPDQPTNQARTPRNERQQGRNRNNPQEWIPEDPPSSPRQPNPRHFPYGRMDENTN